jgi:hypothetical protein
VAALSDRLSVLTPSVWDGSCLALLLLRQRFLIVAALLPSRPAI